MRLVSAGIDIPAAQGRANKAFPRLRHRNAPLYKSGDLARVSLASEPPSQAAQRFRQKSPGSLSVVDSHTERSSLRKSYVSLASSVEFSAWKRVLRLHHTGDVHHC